MIGILISLLILVVIFAVVYWILGMIPVPAEFKWIVNVIVAILFLIALLGVLTGAIPAFYHYPIR